MQSSPADPDGPRNVEPDDVGKHGQDGPQCRHLRRREDRDGPRREVVGGHWAVSRAQGVEGTLIDQPFPECHVVGSVTPKLRREQEVEVSHDQNRGR